MTCSCKGGPATTICGHCIVIWRDKRTFEGMDKSMATEAMKLHKAKVALPEEYVREAIRVLKGEA